MSLRLKWTRSTVAAGAAMLVVLTAVSGPAAYADLEPSPQDAQYDRFLPGQPWNDTSGRTIQAHGGQVVAAHDDDGRRIWYWYGEDRTNGIPSSPGVHVYSSYDLYNWSDRGLALRAMSSADQFGSDPYFRSLYGQYTEQQKAAVLRDLDTVPSNDGAKAAILERPKVIYNAKDKKWVMWVHADGPSETSPAQYAKAKAGVAVSDSPFGPFRYIDSYRLHVAPADEANQAPNNPGMARDMNLFVDDDGSGYIIYASEENASLFVSKLNEHYTGLSAAPASAIKGVDYTRPYVGASREAPAMFKQNGTYYLITSAATGWSPNAAKYATATNILGTWTDHGNPAQGSEASTTFSSQSTSVIPVDPKKGKFIYMGDRWTPNDLGHSPYVWLPLRFGEAGSLFLENQATWSLADLADYEPWQVTSALPDHVWLGEAASLPAEVDVRTGSSGQSAAHNGGSGQENDRSKQDNPRRGGHTKSVPVTWDTSSLTAPGQQSLKGTLADGRTFTRQVVVVPHNLRYVVNAGGAATADWKKTVEVAKTEGAVLNSNPEQPLGTDPVTGATWGYTGSSGISGNADENLYTTLRWAKNKEELRYSFDALPTGNYTVHVGYYDPWPWDKRAAKVTINGTVVDANRTYSDKPAAATYPRVTVGADGKISVGIAPTLSPDIQVSWIMISRTQ
jgi:hypothetical protein